MAEDADTQMQLLSFLADFNSIDWHFLSGSAGREGLGLHSVHALHPLPRIAGQSHLHPKPTGRCAHDDDCQIPDLAVSPGDLSSSFTCIRHLFFAAWIHTLSVRLKRE